MNLKNITVDGQIMRPCARCKKLLPIDQFGEKTNVNGGMLCRTWQSYCFPCKRKYQAARAAFRTQHARRP